jgi:transmembrane sensor
VTVQKSTERRAEAIAWLEELEHGQVPSRHMVQAWEEWIADREREATFDAVVSVWERSGNAGPLALPDADELAADDYDGSVSIAEWTAERGAKPPEVDIEEDSLEDVHAGEVAAARSADTQHRWRWQRAAVAAAAAVALLGWIVYPDLISRPAEPWFYETGVAQHRTVRLEDGSEVFLGARTALWVTFTRQGRTVILDRGEALFDVARDPQRPFVVRAGHGIITAVGTSFSVQRDREHVEVTVAEGVVRVEPHRVDEDSRASSQERSLVATLSGGQQVSYDEQGEGPVSIARVDPRLATSWREGRLQYIDEPLRSVIADVNRYSRRQLVLNGPQVDDLRFTGVIFQDQAGEWGDELPKIFPMLQIVDSDAHHLVLRALPNDGSGAQHH